MSKRYWVAGVATVLGAAWVVAMAADLENLSGQSCGAATGIWHFVNNQTGGAAPGTLMATWDSGDMCSTGPASTNRNVQHFFCEASGALVSASTNLPGRLVLSDFSCDEPPKPPPPCDPKTDPKCEP